MPQDFLNDSFLSSLLNMLEKKQEEGMSEEELLKKVEEMDIGNIYDNVLNNSVDSTFLRFKELTKEAISNNQDHYDRFTNAHRETWGKCLDFYEIMYVICIEAIDRYSKYCSELEKENPDNVKDKIYTFITLREISARACQQYLEIYTLVKNGLADGAYARWRSLYELSIISNFITEYGEVVAKSFYDSSFNYDEKSNEWAKSANCFSHYTNSSRVTFEAIQDNCSSVTENWKKHYRAACKAVHANPISTFGRISIHSDIPSNGIGSIGRSIFGIDEPATHAAVSLDCIITNFFHTFVSGDSVLMQKVIDKWTWFLRDCYNEAASKLDIKAQNN